MTVEAGRGAQVYMVGDAKKAARGSYGTTMEANAAQKLAMELAGTSPTGYTVDGATATGAAPVDPVLASPDSYGFPAMSVANTLTAHAGGTQAAAIVGTTGISRITVCATNADSFRLPVAVAGEMFVVINSGAASAQIFGAGTATINDVATATGVALATTKVGIYFAVTAGLIYGGALA